MKQQENNFPALIIDENGFIGFLIVKKLEQKMPCVFATKDDSYRQERSSLVQVIPLKKRIPQIPGFTYKSIFYILWRNKGSESTISHVVEKARADKAPIVFLIPRELAHDAFVSSLISQYKNLSIIIFADIASGKEEFENRAEELFSEAVNEKKAKLRGDGLLLIRPSLVETLVEKAISVSGFGGSGTYFHYSKNPITELSFVRKLHAMNPDIAITFTKDARKKAVEKTMVFPKKGEWLSDEDFFNEVRKRKMLETEGKKEKKAIKPKNKAKIASVLKIGVVFLGMLLLFPFVVSLFSFLIGGIMLASGLQEFEKGNFDASYKSASSSYQAFSFSENIASDKNLQLVFAFVPVLPTIDVGKDAAEIVMVASDSFARLRNVVGGTSQSPRDDFLSATSGIKKILLLSDAIIFPSKLPFLPREDVLKIQERVRKSKEIIGSFSSFLDSAPFVFGFEGSKKYLVLFQNNMELRPAGGFIGSYGLLTMINGKIEDFTIHDVYDADGQLKGHVEPPYPIRRFLPSVHWYLRDSNFSPDFTVSASSAAYFLQEETGEKVDGVIGVDIAVLKNILDVIGPVYLPDYRMSVQKDTVYKVVQSETEKGFFPGSNQKKNILKSLYDAMSQKIKQGNVSVFALAQSILTSLREKHISIAFLNSSIQNVFTVNKMSSSFWDERRKVTNGIYDFLSVSEANLGVNKSNFYIQRKISYEVDFKEDTAGFSKLTLDFVHTGKQEEKGNDYKAYIRIYVPEGATISEILLNGKAEQIAPAVIDAKIYESKNFQPPSALEVNIGKELGKTFFGFLLIVPSGSKEQVSLTYKLPFRILSKEEKLLYSLLFIKQPGTEQYPFTFSSNFPDTFTASIEGDGNRKSSRVGKGLHIAKDEVFNVILEKKLSY